MLLGHQISKIADRSEERCGGSCRRWSEEEEVVGGGRGANGGTNRGEQRCERSRAEANSASGGVNRGI